MCLYLVDQLKELEFRVSFDKVITSNMLQARICIFILLVIVHLFSLQVSLIRALLLPPGSVDERILACKVSCKTIQNVVWILG